MAAWKTPLPSTSIGTTTRTNTPRSSSDPEWRAGMSMRKFAIVTGASSGIGLELARLAAADGYDLLVAADTPLVDSAKALKDLGLEVDSVETDLAGCAGVDRLLDALGGRTPDLLFANAGHGLGRGFLGQD